MRIIHSDLNHDGNNEILLIKNYPLAGNSLGYLRRYLKSHIEIFKWDGYGIIHDPIYTSQIPKLIDTIPKVFPFVLLGGIIITLVLVLGNLGTILTRYKKIKNEI